MRKNICLGVLAGVVLVIAGFRADIGKAQSPPETISASVTRTEEINQLLEEADTYFQQKEFVTGYDLYLKALGLDPVNQHAREKIYEIADIYKTLATQEEENPKQTGLYYQKYQTMIRDLLQLLMTQLKREIQQYIELMETEKTGADITEAIIPTLTKIIQILQNIKTIYEDFPEGDSGTQKMGERIAQTIQKYEQELARYQEISDEP